MKTALQARDCHIGDTSAAPAEISAVAIDSCCYALLSLLFLTPGRVTTSTKFPAGKRVRGTQFLYFVQRF